MEQLTAELGRVYRMVNKILVTMAVSPRIRRDLFEEHIHGGRERVDLQAHKAPFRTGQSVHVEGGVEHLEKQYVGSDNTSTVRWITLPLLSQTSQTTLHL